MGMRGVLGLVLVLVLAAGVAGIAYNAGMTRGMADSGKIGPPPAGATPYPYYGPYAHGPFGFGFFGFLFPLLFFFLIFGLLKGVFWRPWWGYGHWGRGAPGTLEEWHRRAHGEKGETGPV